MLHFLANQMRESRERMRDEAFQNQHPRRSSSSTRRNSSSSRPRILQHHSRIPPGRRQPSAQSNRRGEELQSPMGFLTSDGIRRPRVERPRDTIEYNREESHQGGITPDQDPLTPRRTGRAISLSPRPNSSNPNQCSRSEARLQRPQESNLEGSRETSDDVENEAASSAWVFMSRRNQRTFARPWRFYELYADWSLTCIHRIFWVSVACIHIGIFLLFMGGFFHKTPSHLASSVVSLGIFILFVGLTMYTLAKSIIRARARQCERVLQVVLDLVETPPSPQGGNSGSQNPDDVVGVAPPPYEAPPPYPGPQDSLVPIDQPPGASGVDGSPPHCCNSDLADGNDTEDPSSKTSDEDPVCPNPNLSSLPPAYSSINLPGEDNTEGTEERDLPPAYSEFP